MKEDQERFANHGAPLRRVRLHVLLEVEVSNIIANSSLEAVRMAEAQLDFGMLSHENFSASRHDSAVKATVETTGSTGKLAALEEFHRDKEWLPGPKPRVLISVYGGVADYVADSGSEVEIFDHDDYESAPALTPTLPSHYSDLARLVGAVVGPTNFVADNE